MRVVRWRLRHRQSIVGLGIKDESTDNLAQRDDPRRGLARGARIMQCRFRDTGAMDQERFMSPTVDKWPSPWGPTIAVIFAQGRDMMNHGLSPLSDRQAARAGGGEEGRDPACGHRVGKHARQ